MALPFMVDDLDIIAKQSDNPRNDGLSTQELKSKFDEAGNLIKDYINTVLVPAINAINAGAVIMSPTAPTVSPALWIDNSNNSQRFVYIDAAGTLYPVFPETDISRVSGLGEFINSMGYVSVYLPLTGWSEQKPYVQSIAVDGMTENWKAGYYTIVSNENIADDLEMQEAAGCITKISTSEGIMSFVCGEDMPESDINIRIHGALEVEANG